MPRRLGRRYEIRVSARAETELDAICEYIAKGSIANAARMRTRLGAAIDGLRYMPRRHSLAPEHAKTGGELRQVIEWPYRVVFEVEDMMVHVHTVRHGAMLPAEDL